MFYLGVGVSKKSLDCLLLDSTTDKKKSKSLPNTTEGFKQLIDWLAKNKAPNAHVVMEPTGVYNEPAALALTDAGLKLSLVNPAQARQFAQGLGMKSKTDKADSVALALYGKALNPEAWQPPSKSARRLKALLVRRDAIADDIQREQNRQEAIDFIQSPDEVKASIAQSIDFLKAELKRLEATILAHIDNDPDLREKKNLLETIPGVGERVSTHMTALFAAKNFKSAEQLAGYLGLVPVQWESGTSVNKRPRMSNTGPGHLRKLLYMPAVRARRWNTHIKLMSERLLAKGKSKMAVIGACMRKLAHLCFGVVHSGRPYQKNYAL